MSSRVPYVASACLHAVLALALASASDLLRPEFMVRSGQSSALATATLARPASASLDSRISPASHQIPFVPPEFPQFPVSESPPPSPANLDQFRVKQEVVAALTRLDGVWPQREALPAEHPVEYDEPAISGSTFVIPAPIQAVELTEAAPSPLRTQTPIETLARVVPAPAPPLVTVADRGANDATSMALNTPQGAKVEHLPRPLPANPVPVYPDELRRSQIGGRVLLIVRVGVDGRVADVRVSQSSGQPALDESALSAVRGWRFEPARQGGQPVALSVNIPIQFSIRG